MGRTSLKTVLLLACLVGLIGLVAYVSTLLLFPLIDPDSDSEINKVEDWIGALPTNRYVYGLIGLLVLCHYFWYMYEKHRVHDAFEIRKADGLPHRDWRAVREIRFRSLAISARARVVLFSICGLLAGGLYFAVYGVRTVVFSDRVSASELHIRTSFESEFDRSITLAEQGRYWFRVLDLNQNVHWGPLDIWHDFGDQIVVIGAREIGITGDRGVTWRRTGFGDPSVGKGSILFSEFREGTGGKSEWGVVVFDRGVVYVTDDGGASWDATETPELRGSERIESVRFGPMRTGFVLTSFGTTYVNTDSLSPGDRSAITDNEVEWRAPDGLDPGSIRSVHFHSDSDNGIASDHWGHVYATNDGGSSWTEASGLELDGGERILWARFHPNHGTSSRGLMLTTGDSFFVSTDGGMNWQKPTDEAISEINQSDWSQVSPPWNSDFGFIVVDRKSVYSTSNGGADWEKQNIEIVGDEWINQVKFARDGQAGIVVLGGGSAIVGDEAGWRAAEGLELSNREWVQHFGLRNRKGVVVGAYGSVYTSESDSNYGWRASQSLNLKEGERVRLVGFDSEQTVGMVVGSKYSVYLTLNGGLSWTTADSLELKDYEAVERVRFLESDWVKAIAWGDSGSVFVLLNDEARWKSTDRFSSDVVFHDIKVARLKDRNDFKAAAVGHDSVIGIDSKGDVYVLRPVPKLRELRNQPFEMMQRRLQLDYSIPPNSVLREELTAFVQNATSLLAVIPVEESGHGDRRGDGLISGFVDVYLSEGERLRVIALVILFFLVRLLVRLYQYCIRLATFWDSRADALLLAGSFSSEKTVPFDLLVTALAPDDYDFRSPGTRYGPFSRILNKVGKASRT